MAATLKFGGDVSRLLRSLKSAERGVEGFSSVAQKSILAATTAMAAMTSQGFRMAADLDLQMRRVQNLTGFSAETRKELTESVEELSKAHGVNATEIALAAEAAHTQGIEVGRLNEVLETGLNVTNAYGGQVENNTRQLVKMAQVWDLTTKQVVAFGQAGAKVGDTNLAKLLTQLANVSTQTSRLNLDFKETSLVLGFATRHMKSTDRAGAALVQVFAELAKLDSKVSVAIQERYGKSFANMVLEAGSAFDVLQTMLDDFGQEPLTQLFGSVEAQSALPSIFLQLEEMKKVAAQSEADLIRGVEGEFANIAESAAVSMNSLRETWNDLLRSLTDPDPDSAMAGLVKTLTETLGSDALEQTLGSIAGVFESAVNIASDLLPLLTELLNAVQPLVSGVSKVVEGITQLLSIGGPSLFEFDDQGRVVLSADAIQALSAGGSVSALERSASIDTRLAPVLDQLDFSNPAQRIIQEQIDSALKVKEANDTLGTEIRHLNFKLGRVDFGVEGTAGEGRFRPFDKQVSDSLTSALAKGNIEIDKTAAELAAVARSQGRAATSRGEAEFLQDLFGELRELAEGDYNTLGRQDEVNMRLDTIAELLGLGNETAEEIEENTREFQDRNYLVVSTLSAEYPRSLSP